MRPEPKPPRARGVRSAGSGTDGPRRRTVYTITELGRAALTRWLSTPLTEPLQLESEAAVRIAFAENGTIDDGLAALAELRAHLAERLAVVAMIADPTSKVRAATPSASTSSASSCG
jgi:hypothetical protein